MRKNKLNITFHNPNSIEDTVSVLIKIAAEIAVNRVKNELKGFENNVNTEFSA